jgi:D-amino peptidase
MRTTTLLAALLVLAASPLAAQAPRIYISADMEGVAGVVTGDQLGPSGFEYERFRRFMTDEVNAAIDAARDAGAGSILVSDSHGNGQNLLLELLPEDVTVVRSWPRSLAMMAGIDSTFDGVIFIGYHASTTNTAGVRAHTMSSANLTAVRLNGQAVPEAGLNAAIAGHFDVPVIMVSGDDAAVAETRHVVGDVEGAVVKWNYGFHSARTLTPGAATKLIGEKVRAAIGRLDEFEPVVLDTPVTLEVSFKSYLPVEVLGYLPNVERIDSHTIRFVGRDMVETSRFLTFIMEYEPGLKP